MSKAIKLADVAIDGGTQQREKINHDIVAEYCEAMKCGAKFPEIIVFFDGVQYWLADGFHRFHACRDAEMLDILADVRQGSRRDALLYSASANGTHGIRLTNADKRKSVFVLLLDKEWCLWSDSKIAKHCHVTHPFVAKIRREIEQPRPVTVTGASPEANKHAGVVFELPKKEAIETEETQAEEYTETDHHIDQLQGAVDTLREENERLTNIAALAVFDGTDEEKEDLAARLEKLTEENRLLRIENNALIEARDRYMRENAELKTQIKIDRKRFAKNA